MSEPLSRRTFLALAPLSALLYAGCSRSESRELDDAPIPEAPKDEAALKQLSTAVNQFGLDLFQQLRSDPANLFLSPISLMAALGMTATGAQGQTLKEMLSTLHLDKLGDKTDAAFLNMHLAINQHGLTEKERQTRYTLEMANAIWGQKNYPWRPEFTKRISEFYRAKLHETDFATNPEAGRKAINDWVSDRTREKIKDIISPRTLKEDTRMVLANAVYFLGSWADKFLKESTKEQPFYLTNGTKSVAPLMVLRRKLAYTETADFQALALPYKANALSMVVILPRKKDGLPDLEAKLKPEMFQFSEIADVLLYLPRFKFEAKFSLPKQLQSLGMVEAFAVDKANFSGMANGPEKLCLQDVIHQSYVDVNEDGTEAAAATVTRIMTGSAPSRDKPKDFRADHPFLFAIRHEATGALLFLGRCENPKS
ncbi:MAG: serpin family protein [Fimbriiglobus sp.]